MQRRPESVDDQGLQLAGERDRWARIRLVLKNLVRPQRHRGMIAIGGYSTVVIFAIWRNAPGSRPCRSARITLSS